MFLEQARALADDAERRAGDTDLATLEESKDIAIRDELWRACALIVKRAGLPQSHFTKQKLADYFQAPEARSFYEEQARFVNHIDDMADRSHDGKALWSPVRMMTLLNRERGPRIADRVLGQDDLQPMMDAVLAHTAPRHAWTTLRALEALSDDYLCENPDAQNALTQWDLSVQFVRKYAYKTWRRARLEAAFWREVSAKSERVLQRLAHDAGDGGPCAAPFVRDMLERALAEEAGLCDDEGIPKHAATYHDSVSTIVRKAIGNVDLVLWLSLEPRAGLEVSFYPAHVAEQLERGLDAFRDGDAPVLNTPMGPLPHSDVPYTLRIVQSEPGAPLEMLQLNPATGGVRSVSRIVLGPCSFAVGAYEDAKGEWRLLPQNWATNDSAESLLVSAARAAQSRYGRTVRGVRVLDVSAPPEDTSNSTSSTILKSRHC